LAKKEEFPFIVPDGRYLLFVRDADIYVSFREQFNFRPHLHGLVTAGRGD